MLLAVLAIAFDDSLQRLNALKGLLSFVIGPASVAFFVVFGPVRVGAPRRSWPWRPSRAGKRVSSAARRLPPNVLRGLVVAFGVVVALWLLVD